MYALVDCNNFYASCERVFRPDLIGKPIAVLSNNDGCVIARSNEAKEAGIPMGAPAFKYKELFAKHKINVFSSNYALYGDMSSRVMNILGKMAPEIEVYSIDEAFLNFGEHNHIDYYSHGADIRRIVTKSTGIPISVGIAPTKALAKIANKIAKKFPDRTNNVHIIDTEEKRLKALRWIPIQDVWGIGRRHAKRLISLNIKNGYDFTQMSDSWVKKHMSIIGLRLKRELEGIPVLEMETTPPAKKHIATTRSFEKPYVKFEELRERVETFAASCAEKLRKQKSCCNAILLFIHTNGHKAELPQYSKNIVVQLPYSTNSSFDMAKHTAKALKCIFKEGYCYKKAGVIAMDIVPEQETQLALFESRDPRHRKLMETLDKINTSSGNHVLKLGSQDIKRTWKMRQERLSPRYTTRLNEIINIIARGK